MKKEKPKKLNMHFLAVEFCRVDKEGRELNIAQAKQVIKFIKTKFKEEPVQMLKLFLLKGV